MAFTSTFAAWEGMVHKLTYSLILFRIGRLFQSNHPGHDDLAGIQRPRAGFCLKVGWLITLAIGFSFSCGPARAETMYLDRIVAVVDVQNIVEEGRQTQIITQSEVDEVVAPILKKREKAGEKADLEKIRKQALEELILRSLRRQKAKQLGIAIEEKDIDALMAKVEQNNRLPPGSLPEILRKQGIALDRYRESLADNLLQSRLISRVIRPMVSVSDEEIQILQQKNSAEGQPEREEIRLGQIFLQVSSSDSPIRVGRTRNLAETLKKKLQAGESLQKLAGEYSNDSSRDSGGDMGWFKRGELMQALEQAVFHLERGAVAGPVRSPQGFHIFKILDRRNGTLSADQPGIVQVKVRHILLKLPEDAFPEAEKELLDRMHAIQKQLKNGVSFAELAKKHSEDATAKDGGDLGWFSKGLMVPQFEEAAFALEKGEISPEPVRTPFGFHLIYLEDKQRLAANSKEAQEKNLKDRVWEAKTQSRYKQWLRDLRQRAFVEFR